MYLRRSLCTSRTVAPTPITWLTQGRWSLVSLLPNSMSLYPAGPKIVKVSGAKIPSWSFVQKNCFLALIILLKILYKQKLTNQFWALIFFQKILLPLIVTKVAWFFPHFIPASLFPFIQNRFRKRVLSNSNERS